MRVMVNPTIQTIKKAQKIYGLRENKKWGWKKIAKKLDHDISYVITLGKYYEKHVKGDLRI